MCHSSDKDGKQAALQREIGQRNARGALGDGTPNLAVIHDIVCLFSTPISCEHRFGVYGAKAACPR